MRYMIKGGIWKNTEDEILKAAVMKYGLNQWSRISSLLVRKSAKECKARWYEWLDPNIHKTEWTREEEEKLLHLAKIFPCQWRTIAPVLGRTPAQCVEHYEKLLDKAQGKEEDIDENDPRRLRPGEIDPNPESKAPRPDEIDMDEDIKEMLQEARSRISNTKGKKAKRKLREKILEEARRLATLQKKRELRTVGIDFDPPKPRRKRKKPINYNVEVTLQRIVPEGRFEDKEEENPIPNEFKANISVQQIEGKRRDEEEDKQKLIDQKRMRKLKDKNLPKVLLQSNYQEYINLLSKPKLALPIPQISDQEIESLSKLMQNEDSFIENNSNDATSALVGKFGNKETIAVTPMRTQNKETLLREATNQAILLNSQTPLIGGVNTPLKEQSSIIQGPTPNPLLMRLGTGARSNVFPTPMSSKRPSSTRNNIGTPLHKESQEDVKEDDVWEDEANAEKLLKSLQENLKKLPQPKNNFKFELPELPTEESDKELPNEQAIVVEQQEKYVTEVSSRGLPIPLAMDESQVASEAEKLIANEMKMLILHDNDKVQLTQINGILEATKLIKDEEMLLIEAKNSLKAMNINSLPKEETKDDESKLAAELELLQADADELTILPTIEEYQQCVKQFEESYKEYNQSQTLMNVYLQMKDKERSIIPLREKELMEALQYQSSKESVLQDVFINLKK